MKSESLATDSSNAKVRFRDVLWAGASWRVANAFVGLVGINLSSYGSLSYFYESSTSPLAAEVLLGFKLQKQVSPTAFSNFFTPVHSASRLSRAAGFFWGGASGSSSQQAPRRLAAEAQDNQLITLASGGKATTGGFDRLLCMPASKQPSITPPIWRVLARACTSLAENCGG